jgi:hypothetical protein
VAPGLREVKVESRNPPNAAEKQNWTKNGGNNADHAKHKVIEKVTVPWDPSCSALEGSAADSEGIPSRSWS